jgi:hypothetical protein
VTDALSWEAQGEEIRRLTAECLATLAARIDNGQQSDEDLEQLSKLSTIARTWRAAELRGGEPEDEPASKVDDVALMRRAKI